MTEKMGIYPADALIMAPLSGFTDLPYRRSLRRQKCLYAFTEMVDVASIAYNHPQALQLLERGGDESFLGCQLEGSDIEHFKIAVDKVNEFNFDVLDLNLGCPVPKVTKKGAGAALGRNIDAALKIFQLMRARSRFPVSAKIRIIDASSVEPTLKLVRALDEAGAVAITIHGRIKEVFYAGEVNFEQIKNCRQEAACQIIANGGVSGCDKYLELREKTGCTEVMLARGAMGNPYLFRELTELKDFVPPSIPELIEDINWHVRANCDYYGEANGMKISRKIVHDYLRGRGFRSECRARASSLTTLEEFDELLKFIERNHSGNSYFDLQNSGSERRLRP